MITTMLRTIKNGWVKQMTEEFIEKYDEYYQLAYGYKKKSFTFIKKPISKRIKNPVNFNFVKKIGVF